MILLIIKVIYCSFKTLKLTFIPCYYRDVAVTANPFRKSHFGTNRTDRQARLYGELRGALGFWLITPV